MWTEQNNCLEANLTFQDFAQAWAFMTEAAFLVEKHNHHPEWSNVYNRVQIRLRTHDAGNIVTEKDRSLAADLEIVAHRYSASTSEPQ
ncbi:MAG: 4a-hydroxytetrahydrobiopterin dehydratase [Bacteroidota bacterium]